MAMPECGDFRGQNGLGSVGWGKLCFRPHSGEMATGTLGSGQDTAEEVASAGFIFTRITK